jgi:Dockerin type I domain
LKNCKVTFILVVVIFVFSIGPQLVRGSLVNTDGTSSFLGDKTFTNNYFSNCVAYARDGPTGNTMAGWFQGYCGNHGVASSNGMMGAYSQSVSQSGGGSSGGVTQEIDDYGSYMNGATITYSGCFLGPQPNCEGGNNADLVGDQTQSSSHTCTGPPCYTFYVPNYGQTLTPVDLSTDVYLIGGLKASTSTSCFGGCIGSGDASARLTISLTLKNTDNQQLSTLSIIDVTKQCATSGSSCNDGITYNQDIQQAGTFRLQPGHYLAFLTTIIVVASDATLGGTGSGYACFYSSSNCPAGPTTNICASGAQTNNGYCQFIQWKWTTYTIHYPTISVSSTPSSLALNNAPSTTTTLTVQSTNVIGANNPSYDLSAPILLSASSSDPNLNYQFSSYSVTPPQGGSASSILTISDSYRTCDYGLQTITVSLSVNDGASIAASQLTSINIPLSVATNCDFAISSSPSLYRFDPGKSGSITVYVTPVNPPASTVTFSNSVNGLTCNLSPTGVNLPGSAVLTCSGVNLGTYTDTVTGSSGSVNHSTTVTFKVQTLRGDINNDCVVNIIDLSIVGGHFGLTYGSPGWDPRADVNGDGIVNIIDLSTVAGNFGGQCQ